MVNLGEAMRILELHREGLTISAIAERTGKDRKTVRKYIRQGLSVPSYKVRAARARVMDPYLCYVSERINTYPELTASRLLREVRELGYRGGRTALADVVREVRPRLPHFELRFETPPGRQAQVDFAYFEVEFEDAPGKRQIVWLFSLVLGHSRYLWARYVLHQDLATVLRCHLAAFADLGGVPAEILYDRMKTAVLGEAQQEPQHIVYNPKLVALAQHYGFTPRACRAYRAQTKGKVERPYRYIRQDFFLGRRFRNLEDLNAQLRHWLDTVANVRLHGTTQRVVAEHFAEEQGQLQPLPALAFDAVIRLERRISHEGMVSVAQNFYSVPDGTRKRVVEVQMSPTQVRLYEAGTLIAVHPVLEGRHQRSLLRGHRRGPRVSTGSAPAHPAAILTAPGQRVARRSLDVYASVGAWLAQVATPTGGAR
ncbi:MAG: IS21 family transposase [Betaproteobacteria bacterium]